MKPDFEKSDKIILSVGMIVKNEEKYLDKCLSALQKLRDNVSNELIIVDTGSTDKTKEIALKYTDKVYDFKWINDFSAARNCGLEKAVGEWFMYIDADEYIDEDCGEMIDFFNTPELSSKYNSAAFVMLNYSRAGGYERPLSRFIAPRIVRNYEGLRFSDPIHEWLPQSEPNALLSTVFHHYGYVYETKAEKNIKSKRNLEPMLKAYEQSPHDLRVLNHLCSSIYNDDYFNTLSIKEKYLEEYFSESKKNINLNGASADPYALISYLSLSEYYNNYENYKKAACVLEEFVSLEYIKNSMYALVAYYYLARTYINYKKYSDAFTAIEKYFEYYEKYNNKELCLDGIRYIEIQGISEYEHDEMVILAAKCLNNLERHEDAAEYIDKVDFSGMDFVHADLFAGVLKDFSVSTHEYEDMFSCYEKAVDLNDRDKKNLMLSVLEQCYMEFAAERKCFINEAVKCGKNGMYFELAHLIKDDMDGKDISEELADFLRSAECWKNGYSEAIYLAMKHKADITPALERMGNNIIKNIIKTISDGHEAEYAEVALDYCLDFDYSAGIKQMLWCVSVLEAAVIKSNELSSEKLPVLFDFFVSILSDYVGNIYNPELMNSEDIDVLPELHRFGYFIAAAFGAKNEGDIVNYVRNMKEALRVCEHMKNVVSFYLNELEKEMKR